MYRIFKKQYPRRLSELDGAPYALYVKGKLPEEDRPSVAIIGARRCSNYGEGQALEYGKCLASARGTDYQWSCTWD